VAGSAPEAATTPSYIKPLAVALRVDGGEAEGAQAALLENLTAALGACGLPPWRINTYASGAGKILWLSNGAHIDLTPRGELNLGGESQDETRAALARVGLRV